MSSRPLPRTRWARCALALLAVAFVASPALADSKKKKKGKKKTPVSACASFDQRERDDEGVDLVVGNQCDVKLSCAVSWTLTCAPDTRHVSRTPERTTFALDTGGSQSTLASPATCGNAGWMIDDVTWTCQPDPEPVQVGAR
jgi:hypothetical protein